MNLILPGLLLSAMQYYLHNPDKITDQAFSWGNLGATAQTSLQRLQLARSYAIGVFTVTILWFISLALRLGYMKFALAGDIDGSAAERTSKLEKQAAFARWNAALISPFRRGASGWALVLFLRGILLSVAIGGVPIWASPASNMELGGAWDPTEGFEITRQLVIGGLAFFLALDTAVNPWGVNLVIENEALETVSPDQICEQVSFLLLMLTTAWSGTSSRNWNSSFQVTAGSLGIAFLLFCLAWCFITLFWDRPRLRCKSYASTLNTYFWGYAGAWPPIGDWHHPDAVSNGLGQKDMGEPRHSTRPTISYVTLERKEPMGEEIRDDADSFFTEPDWDDSAHLCTCCGLYIGVGPSSSHSGPSSPSRTGVSLSLRDDSFSKPGSGKVPNVGSKKISSSSKKFLIPRKGGRTPGSRLSIEPVTHIPRPSRGYDTPTNGLPTQRHYYNMRKEQEESEPGHQEVIPVPEFAISLPSTDGSSDFNAALLQDHQDGDSRVGPRSSINPLAATPDRPSFMR
jgi:hypothetical protein